MRSEEWVDDTEAILKKNKHNELTSLLIILIGYILFIILVVFNQFGFALIIITSSILIPFFLKFKKIKLSFSEILAYDLFNIYKNIKKYKGKNEYFQQECFSYLTDVDYVVIEYIKRKRKESEKDFNYEKIILYLKKLIDQNKKVEAFFKNYESNKHMKRNLEDIYSRLFSLFHEKEEFPVKVYEIIDSLENLEIELVKPKYEFKKILKKYFVDNKLYILIIFCSVFVVGIWFIPNYTSFELSSESKLVIIIPIMAAAIIQYLFSGKLKEKQINK